MSDKEIIGEVGSPTFPRKNGNGSCTDRVFTVEVRYDYPDPQAHGTFIIDREWRQLPISITPFNGVPNQVWSANGARSGYLSWPCANALRWWAHAAFGVCLQSRIVEHRIEEKYDVTTLGYHDVIGGGGNDDRTRLSSSPLGKPLTENIPLYRSTKV